MNGETEVQRSLGRIEGAQSQILNELRALTRDFQSHTTEDGKNFTQTNNLMYLERDKLQKQIQTMQEDQARAKGAGWVIIGLLGAFATFVGSAVLEVASGKIKLHY